MDGVQGHYQNLRTAMTSVADETKVGDFREAIRIGEGSSGAPIGVGAGVGGQTLNKMLDAEADAQCGAKQYARTPERLGTRAGHYDRLSERAYILPRAQYHAIPSHSWAAVCTCSPARVLGRTSLNDHAERLA